MWVHVVVMMKSQMVLNVKKRKSFQITAKHEVKMGVKITQNVIYSSCVVPKFSGSYMRV